jgi:hypothetical protein
MNERCPVCKLAFEREPGYFVAAMYVSYALAVPLLGLIALAIHEVRPGWSSSAVLMATLVAAVPFVPALFRYSRVLWIHLDRSIDRSP